VLATKTAPYPAVHGRRRDHRTPTRVAAADRAPRRTGMAAEPTTPARDVARDADIRLWPGSVWFEPPWAR
jgi:hypothetical protein